MVKIPSFARRERSADVDDNRTANDETVVRERTTDRPVDDRADGPVRADGAERATLFGRWADRDRTRAAEPPTGRATPVAPVSPSAPPADRTAGSTAGPSAPPAGSAAPYAGSTAGPNAPTPAERRLAGTDLTDDTRPTEPVTDEDARPEPTPDVPVGPRPRTSVMATLSLILGVAGAFLVLSGALAGYGIAVGAIGFLLAVAAFPATRKRHVAGKLDATLGLLIGGAAVVIGVLAFTGSFTWPTTDADWVERLREWLDSQFVDRF
ncbi:thrombospondin [Asanoa siamensis]|uniref:Thrombospondin n=1 Tax=Asanoa siamensis TaxID=926357 RepID=A0ABQ4CTG2_9ACTN|nr:thrombospondin [Asanoa siamensis]GIF74571.1 hypothetical protein Asi02nite_40890 [Asanoa siamensis]